MSPACKNLQTCALVKPDRFPKMYLWAENRSCALASSSDHNKMFCWRDVTAHSSVPILPSQSYLAKINTKKHVLLNESSWLENLKCYLDFCKVLGANSLS